VVRDNEGREAILAILNRGDFFGEMGLIDQAPRSATVVTLEACELLTITRADFMKCLQKNFNLSMSVIRGSWGGCAKRTRRSEPGVDGRLRRVARLLMETAETVDGQKVVTRKLPRSRSRR